MRFIKRDLEFQQPHRPDDHANRALLDKARIGTHLSPFVGSKSWGLRPRRAFRASPPGVFSKRRTKGRMQLLLFQNTHLTGETGRVKAGPENCGSHHSFMT